MRATILISLAWLSFLLIAPIFSPHNPRQTNPENIQQAPSITHLFGTDNIGRDVFSRTIHGGRRTIFISLVAMTIAIVPAILVAILNSMSSQWFDAVIQILLNALLAFPSLLVALVILTLLGRGFFPIAIATGIAQFPFYLQIARNIFKQEQSRQYVIAAKSLGASNLHITIYHIIPNARPTLIAYASITFAYCIINSAALSLLGLGGDPSIPDWGVMLATGRDAFRSAPWSAFAPALAISFTVILANKLADTLR